MIWWPHSWKHKAKQSFFTLSIPTTFYGILYSLPLLHSCTLYCFKNKSPFTSNSTLCIFYTFLSFPSVLPLKINYKFSLSGDPCREYPWFRVQGCLETRKWINTTPIFWVQGATPSFSDSSMAHPEFLARGSRRTPQESRIS